MTPALEKPFTFVWYNAENLYDTVDDPQTMDDDFTPSGKFNWTQKRFDKKIKALTNVITDIAKPGLPDIIGLGEVENNDVLIALIDELRRQNIRQYSFVHYDSPDERGIDVAILYDTQTFKVEGSRPIRVQLDGIENRTRDILYVKGKMSNGETIHLLTTHFPSRREGSHRSEPRRYLVASELKLLVDNLLMEDEKANIVIMGDFNDTPDDNSIDEVLGAKKTFATVEHKSLYNLLYPRAQRGMGTTYHKGWLLFDQIIVSGNMLLSEKIDCRPEYADVFNPRYLLHFEQNGVRLNRTQGKHYFGGYSDHLPVFLTVGIIEK